MMQRFFPLILAAVLTVLLGAVSGCAHDPRIRIDAPPIVFIHGDDESEGVWQDLIWRFESNGWPRQRLFALQQPYPRARDLDSMAQAGRSSDAEELTFLKVEIDKIIEQTGAQQVVLIGRGRGAFAAKNYIVNGGEQNVRQAIFASPDVMWTGTNKPQALTEYDSAMLNNVKSLVIAHADQRDGAISPAQFAEIYLFITGQSPTSLTIWPQFDLVLDGVVTGMGVLSGDRAKADSAFYNNLPVPGARVEIFEVQRDTGLRLGPARYHREVGADGRWGPLRIQQGSFYEFVVRAPGYAVTHIYRSPFARGSNLVNLKASRIADEDLTAYSIIQLERLRGSLDPELVRVEFDGQSPPPRKVTLTQPQNRAVSAEIQVESVERVTGRSWPAKDSHVVCLELAQ